MTDGIYVDEFLYRGRHNADDTPPAWHLVLVAVGQDAFGQPYRDTTPPLNMAQAEERGWSLPEIIEAINAEAMAECDKLRADVASLSRQIESASAAIAENATLKEKVKTLKTYVVDLEAQVKASE